MKKVLSLLIVVMMIFSMTACSPKQDTPKQDTPTTPMEPTTPTEPTTPNTEAKAYKAALLLNGTLGDKSFFDSANEGLTKLRDELSKEKFDFKVEQMGATPADESKWEPTLLDYCDSKEYDVIIMGTWQMADALAKAAKQYPDQKFIFFDEAFDFEGNENPSNIYNVLYKQNEVSYLVGAAAAMMTVDSTIANIDPANKLIGFLGGMDNVVIRDFLLGYIQGATDVDKDTKVAIAYVGNFYDSPAGKELSLAQYQGGVDVGYNVAGAAGLGQIEAAEDTKKYAFGVDSDQGALLPEKAPYIPSSALKNVGNSLYRAINLDLEGKLGYGKMETLGLAEGGVEIVKDKHYEEFMPEAIKTKLDQMEADIISGKIVVDTSDNKTTEEVDKIKAAVAPQ